jgi:predicted lipoprotein with Yx(FWY)xxD motif
MISQPITAFFKKTISRMGALVLLGIAVAACQPAAVPPLPPVATSVPVVTSAPEVTTAPIATSAPEVTMEPVAPAAAQPEAVINVASDAKLGKILVDGKGMTLYMFTKDEADKSNCSGKCIDNWPPLLTQGHPTLGEGVDASMIGTATLADGSMIVSYNHMPLYTFIKDKAPGDITGQGSNNVWYVVAPDGKAVGMEVTINVVEDPKLGKILVDGKGMTLYMFTKDEPDKSNCSGKCIENWPPLLTQGHPTLGEGVDASMIGTATLADGSMIVTYNHMPLYYWIKDKSPGDTTGQGNNKVWYVVAPNGNPVGR